MVHEKCTNEPKPTERYTGRSVTNRKTGKLAGRREFRDLPGSDVFPKSMLDFSQESLRLGRFRFDDEMNSPVRKIFDITSYVETSGDLQCRVTKPHALDLAGIIDFFALLSDRAHCPGRLPVDKGEYFSNIIAPEADF